MLATLSDQIGKLRGQVAKIYADVVGIRYFIPELTQRVKTLELGFEALRQKVEAQAALIEALEKTD